MQFSRTDFDNGAFWQLFTSQWVHLNALHAASNWIVFFITLLIFNQWIPVRQQLLTLIGGFSGVAMLLIWDTQCLFYAGLSGALHGMWVGNALLLTKDSFSRQIRSAALFFLLFVALKIVWQAYSSGSNFNLWLNIPVYLPAHAAGAVGGLLVSLAMYLASSFGQFFSHHVH
jgi:rhomboid family GlyGly-CTERM serine protease